MFRKRVAASGNRLPLQQVVIFSSIGYAEEKLPSALSFCRRTLIMNIRLIPLLTLCSILVAALFSEAIAVTLDPDFGEDGRVAVELGIYGSRANAVLAQKDGKILVAGSSTSTADKDFMLFRLLPNGELDTNFNYDGTVTTHVGSYDDEALTLALQSDGKILAGGYTNNGENRDFALVRYNSDGSLDRDFGLEGMTVTAVGSSNDEITDMAVQKDGSIVITGAAQGKNGRVVVLARYKADGTLDTSFAKDGFSLSMTGVDAQAESVALSETGRILVSGSYSDGKKRGLMLLGFDAAGQLDKTFGEKGIAVPADSSSFSEGYGMLLAEDGKILVAGSVGEEGERDAALFRFTAEGQPDSSFEKDGVLVVSAGEKDDVLYDVAEVGEKVAAAGFKTVDEKRVFLLITYEKGSSADADNLSSSSVTMQAAESDESDSTEELTTLFGDDDKSTALSAVSNDSMVAVGESTTTAGVIAAVSKYLTEIASGADAGSSTLDLGSSGLETFEPGDVTRTTAILSGKVKDMSNVTEVGFVFSTMPNPTKEGSSAADSSGAPTVTNTSASTVSGESATISLTTDVDATCKYDTDAGTAYDDMADTFTTTGEKIHAQILSDLTAGETYTYYARCKGTDSGVANSVDTTISFTVQESGTDSGPTRSNLAGTPSGTSAKLSLTTDVPATCRYDATSGTSYDSMEKTFGTTGGTSHSETIFGLSAGTYTYYIRCKNDSTEAVNTTDKTISVTVKSSNGTEDTTPPIISETTAASFNTDDDVVLKISTSEAATCRYSETDETYDNMVDEFDTTGGTSHSVNLGTMAADEYTYYVRCKDEAGNKNSSGKKIEFTVSKDEGPNRTNLAPSGTISSTSTTLNLTTDVDAICKYDTVAETAYDDMDNTFSTTGGKSHSESLSNLSSEKHTYYVRCKNTATGDVNTTDAEISFTVSSTPPPPGASNFQPVINTALQSVGSFFVSTAYAQTTVTTDDSTDTAKTDDSTSTASASSNTSTASGDNSKADTADNNFFEDGYITAGSGNGTFSSKVKDLKPGTFFYARIYAISNGSIYYGNQVGFRTGDSCFVATAAFGSIFAPAVQTLRDFRDQFLSGNAAARALVDFYYQVSPNIADVISQHSTLRFVVRMLLLPVTGAAWLALQLGIWMLLLPTAAMLLLGGWLGLQRRQNGTACASHSC